MNAVTTNEIATLHFYNVRFWAERMTNRQCRLSGPFFGSASRLQARRSIRTVAAACVAVCLVGCGVSESTNTTTTSNDDIAAFIKENPEFGNSTAASAGSLDSSELSLER